MAKPDLVRHINQARALRLLKEQGILSRAELARFLNLNGSTLTFVTGELLRRNLIREAGEPLVTQATGRPGTGLKLNPDGAYFLGAEIGAERVHLVLIDSPDRSRRDLIARGCLWCLRYRSSCP
jgi:hypothetical protein